MSYFHAVTDVGCSRPHNEDAFLRDPEHGVFVVADGVGGRAAGEVASAITVETFSQAAAMLQEAVLHYAENPTLANRNYALEALDETCQQASRRVFEAAEARNLRGMTTTVVVAAVGGGWAFVAHVGDSRAYLLRDGEVRQLSEDHSMVNELVRSGQMTLEEAQRSRYRNVITRAVGLHPTVQPDLLAIEMLPGDRILLNTDGLSDVVTDEVIARLGSKPDIREATESLLEEALGNGAPDNVTHVLLEPEASPQAGAAIARAQIMEDLFLFRDLPFHARLRVSRICDELFFTPGQVILSQSAPGNTMYVVVQGEVAVSRDGVELARLGPGEHFGEIALADQQPRSATVTGVAFGSLITIGQTQVLEFCRREPELGNQILWKLLRTLARRLRETNALVAGQQDL